jgi:hypothetical protein
MLRAAFLALPLLAVPAATPLPAFAAASVSAEQSRTGENCEQRNQRSRRRGRGIGGMFGSIVGGRLGGLGGVVGSVLPVGELLGEAIAGLLDCREQQQAAHATEEAVRGGAGTTASWQSETRPSVTGSSTVMSADSNTVEGQCMTVTDIVIIDGQETRAPKRMCRRPPNNRYVRV